MTNPTHERPISFVGMNIHQVKTQLAEHLGQQEQSLEKTSPISRNAILTQTKNIQKELDQLERFGQKELPDSLRFKLETLSNELVQIKTNSPLLPPPTSRRSKFQAKSNHNPDINFATEIGQGLLIEVRKLQNVILEKKEIIKRLEASRLESERQSELAQRQLRQREENEESLKEENWNLEVVNQDLVSHLTESNATIAKHNADYARLTKQIKEQSEQLEIMKAQEEKKSSMIEAMKARHEQEMHQLRKHTAQGQRENAQVQQQLDSLRTELKICKAKLAIKQAVHPTLELEPSEEFIQPTKPSEDPATPVPGTRHQPQMETETLRQSLAHAHRIISNLRGSAHKEKMEKFELKKLLADSQETIEQLRKEPQAKCKKPRNLHKKQRKGVARKPRGVVSSSSSTSELSSEEEEQDLHVLNLGLGLGFGTPLLSEKRSQGTDMGVNTSNNLTWVLLDSHSVFPSEDDFISSETAEKRVQQALDNAKKERDQLTAACAESEKTIAVARKKEADLVLQLQASVTRTHFDEVVAQAQEKEAALLLQIEASLPKHVADKQLADAVAIEKELSIPRKDVDMMLSDRVLKSEMEAKIAEALDQLVLHTSNTTVPKEEMEQLLANTVPQSEVDALLAQAAESATLREKKNTIAKIEEMMKNMVHKSEVEEIVAKTVQNQTNQEEPTIPVTASDTLIAKAREEGFISGKAALENEYTQREQDYIPKSKVDILIASSRNEGIITGRKELEMESAQKEKDMVSKADMEALVSKAVLLESERMALTMISKEEAELQLEEAKKIIKENIEQKNEVQKNHALKSEAEQNLNKLKSEWAQKMEQETVSKVELDRTIEQVKNTAKSEYTKKIDVMHQQIACMMTQEQHQASIKEATEKARLGMVDQETMDKRVAESTEIALESHRQDQEKTHSEFEAKQNALKDSIQYYKNEYEEANLQMRTMLTKESADILVKRAVADAVKQNEKKQQEVLMSMSPKTDIDILVKKAVKQAIENERKEVGEREAIESMTMISKVEAEALAKVAAADAIVNERQAQAAREKDMILREEADKLSAQAIQNAIEKEKLKNAEALAKERKAMKEKEDNMVTKEKMESLIADAVRTALEKEKSQAEKIQSDVPCSPQEIYPPLPAPERSVSTSRLSPPSIKNIPTPSVSTPSIPSKGRLRLNKSVSSLRRKASNDSVVSKKEQSGLSADNYRGFGTLRVLETTTYSPRKAASKTSLKNISKKGSTASLSTIATEDAHPLPAFHGPSADTMSMFADSEGNTDMDVISSITQTMIGEWMMKHTRRYVGSGISEHRHKRFFWVHPYTKSLYWSSIEPGVDGSESKAKSAFIESVVVVSNQSQQENCPVSLLIRTGKRDIKITAPNLERHDIWHKSMLFLVGRGHSAQQTSAENLLTEVDNIKGMIPGQEAQYDSDDSEDMINIRQCCDGKHDLTSLSKKHSHT
ncbi:hypothetical protein BY458DRAFT_447189 [Sporodiniella umbellata]|nr:hypothetical protein BY458DRAFT_447189 [Sporodiniella umbellata]